MNVRPVPEDASIEQIGTEFQLAVSLMPTAIRIIADNAPVDLAKKMFEDIGRVLGALEAVSEIKDLGENILNASMGMGATLELKGGNGNDQIVRAPAPTPEEEALQRRLLQQELEMRQELLEIARLTAKRQRQELEREPRRERLIAAGSLVSGLLLTILLFAVLYIAYVVPVNTAATLVGTAAGGAVGAAAATYEGARRWVAGVSERNPVVAAGIEVRRYGRWITGLADWAVFEALPALPGAALGAEIPAAPQLVGPAVPAPPPVETVTQYGVRVATQYAAEAREQAAEVVFGVARHFFGQNIPWWTGPFFSVAIFIIFTVLSHIGLTRAYAGLDRTANLGAQSAAALNAAEQLANAAAARRLEGARVELIEAQVTAEGERARAMGRLGYDAPAFRALVADAPPGVTRGRALSLVDDTPAPAAAAAAPIVLGAPAPAAEPAAEPAAPRPPLPSANVGPRQGGEIEGAALKSFIKELDGGKKRRRSYKKKTGKNRTYRKH